MFFIIKRHVEKIYIINNLYNVLEHFEIESLGIYVFMDQGPYMHSLEHLVDHYAQFAEGLPCRLLYPVSPQTPILPLPPSMCQICSTLHE